VIVTGLVMAPALAEALGVVLGAELADDPPPAQAETVSKVTAAAAAVAAT
jgi:hypothetical protein